MLLRSKLALSSMCTPYTKKEMKSTLEVIPACFAFPALIQETRWKKDPGKGVADLMGSVPEGGSLH